MFDNRVLREIRTFEPNRVEVIGGCRKLCTGDLEGLAYWRNRNKENEMSE